MFRKIDSMEIAKIGVLSALGVIATSLFRIPGPGGNVYFHMGETIILSSAVILGKRGGMAVGAIASSIADLLLGAALWAPASFIIHGVEGWLVGSISDTGGGKKDLAAMLAGVSVMTVSYTCVAGVLYGTAIMPVEFFGDSMQSLLGIATAFPLTRLILGKLPRMRRMEPKTQKR